MSTSSPSSNSSNTTTAPNKTKKEVQVPHKSNDLLHRPGDQRFLCIGVSSALLFFLGDRIDSHVLCVIAKPIPIFCLIGWVLWNTKGPSWFPRLITAGLIFGSIGDILLSLNYEDSFIHGLAAFLVGHICYCSGFRFVRAEMGLHWQLLHAVPFMAWSVCMMGYLTLSSNLGAFFTPMAVYTVLLTTLCWQSTLAAMDRIAHSGIAPHYAWFQRYAPLLGACMFTLSDSMIAFEKFLPGMASSSTTRMVHMSLYYLGQWAIAYSTIQRKGSATRASA